MVAAPGVEVEHEGSRWRFTLAGGRDFALSMSPLYERLAQMSDDGTQVELYTFGERTAQTAGGTVDNTHQALTAAAQALAIYSDLFGAYPHDRFVIVQGDFPDGMEFSGIVFVGEAWFRTNPGSARSYLTIITVHETSHQWWYARVGSDQALYPWLDEALAVYSEYIFYEERYPDLRQWWWNFRVDSFVPPDYAGRQVDSSIYQFETGREYINAVYLRGAQMMDALRQDLGTDAFFDWLRRYADAGQNEVVTPDVFWSLLTPDQFRQTSATRATYLNGDQP
jgi:aminopeptidase N